MQLWFARFLQIFGKFPQSLRSGAQIIDILAEGKAGVRFPDMTVFVAVELFDDVSELVQTPRQELTSLTGMLDTPISMAMNQQALEKRKSNLERGT